MLKKRFTISYFKISAKLLDGIKFLLGEIDKKSLLFLQKIEQIAKNLTK